MDASTAAAATASVPDTILPGSTIPLSQITERVVGQRYTGVCKTWRTDKSFGFLSVDDGGKDVFCHQSAITIEGSCYRAMMPGQPVQFTLQIRENKEMAADVTNKDGTVLKGFASKLEATTLINAGPMEPGDRMGKVKFFSADKGYGFITPDDGGGELFFNISDVIGRCVLEKDEPIRYTIGEGRKPGQEQAKNIKRLLQPSNPQPSADPYAQFNSGAYAGYNQPPAPPGGGVYSPYGAYGGYPQAGYGAAAAAEAVGPSGPGAGTIKWYNAEKAFGFIIPSSGGKDVYFKGDAITDGTTSFNEGDPVTYEQKTGDNKAWATNVQKGTGNAAAGAAGHKRKADGYPDASGYKVPRAGETHYGGVPAQGAGFPGYPGYNPPPQGAAAYGHPAGAAYDPYGAGAAAAGGAPAAAYYGGAPAAAGAPAGYPQAGAGEHAGYPHPGYPGAGGYGY